MTPFTTGKIKYAGKKIPLAYYENQFFSELEQNREFLSIIYIKKGSGILKIGDRNKAFFSPSVFCFNEKCRVALTGEEDLDYTAVYFHPIFLNDSLSLDSVYKYEPDVPGSHNYDHWLLKQLFGNMQDFKEIIAGPLIADKILNLLINLKDQFFVQEDKFWPCRGRSFFIELLILLERAMSNYHSAIDDFPETKEMEEIYPVILHLNNSYREKNTISELAQKFNTNRTTLREKFIKATGVPPINYLIKLRVRISSVLLMDTSIPVSEIIERVGFEDLTHFGRMFKKYTGVTPTEYRNKFRIPGYILN